MSRRLLTLSGLRVERFLHEQAATIAVRLLEIGDDHYTRRFVLIACT